MSFGLSWEEGQEILQLPEVRDALHRVAAERILPAASSMAAQAGLTQFASSLRVEDGVRPKGRPYSRVIADSSDAVAREFGDSRSARYRILGRAAGVTIWPNG